FEEPKPDFGKIKAYFNIDYGTGSVNNMNVFGPDATRELFTEVIGPFTDWGTTGTVRATRQSAGSTDSSSFSRAGIVAVNMEQSDVDYIAWTHHTSYDTYEHADSAQLKKASLTMAVAAWYVANCDT